MVLIPKGNSPYKRNSKDGQQKVEDRYNDKGIKIEGKDQDVLTKDIIVALTPKLISDISQHKRWAKYMHKCLSSVKYFWITSANKIITYIAEVNSSIRHTDYLADGTGLLPWKYWFTQFHKLDASLLLFKEAIPDSRNKLYHIPDHDIAVPTLCLWSAEGIRP